MICRALLPLSVLAFALGGMPALANDSTAELGAGGLQLVRNGVVELLSEDLYVSAKQVKVTYHFRNNSSAPATYVVAFPLPAIDATVPEAINVLLPDAASDNFVDFTVSVDGQAVTPSLSERAFAFDVDRTDEIKAAGLPLNPLADGLYDQLGKLAKDKLDPLNRIGAVIVDSTSEPVSNLAAWSLKAAFYWEQTFPPGKEVVVEHTYKPVVGTFFFGDYVFTDTDYKTRYCMDNSFITSAKAKLAAIAKLPTPYLDGQRISYILTTANNWAAPIRSFRLVVDKGSPDALVSFCGTGVTKISPTQFEVTATDFSPDKELEILIATPPRIP